MENILNDVVTFDIETESLSDDFFNAQKNNIDTFDFMPHPRVCVCHDSLTDQYETYLPDDFPTLYTKLMTRNILSFNGIHFDVNVILKHLRKNRNDPLAKKENHYDLLDLIIKKTGERYRLDDLVRSNFNERKHTSGRNMENLDIEKLSEACRSDVDHTFRLMKIYLSGKIVYRYYGTPKTRDVDKHDLDHNHAVMTITSTNIQQFMKFIEKRDKDHKNHDYLIEAIANGHKYREKDKILALDNFLIEKIGQRSDEVVFSDGVPLSFEERCKILSDLLILHRVHLPVDWLEECMTEGQLVEYLGRIQ